MKLAILKISKIILLNVLLCLFHRLVVKYTPFKKLKEKRVAGGVLSLENQVIGGDLVVLDIWVGLVSKQEFCHLLQCVDFFLE